MFKINMEAPKQFSTITQASNNDEYAYDFAGKRSLTYSSTDNFLSSIPDLDWLFRCRILTFNQRKEVTMIKAQIC